MQDFSILFSAFGQFPIIALIAMGFYISFRLLKFPDLTVDAAYMFGMACVGWIVLNFSASTLGSLFLSIFIGALVGAITGILYSKNTGKILAGMLVAFASYSLCYRMLDHKASLSLFNQRDELTLFGMGDYSLLINFLLVVFIYLIVVNIIKTPFGYAMKVNGSNPKILKTLGINASIITIFGLAFANSIVAIGGWLNAVTNASVHLSNFEMIINALAAVLLGEFIFLIVSAFYPKIINLMNSSYVAIAIPVIGAFIFTLLNSSVLYFLSGELKVAITTDFQLVLSLIIIGIVIMTARIKSLRGGKVEDVF